MDASRDGECHKDTDEQTVLQTETTINIQVVLLGGQAHSFETQPTATVSDIKALIHYRLYHHPKCQTLILDTTILEDSNALLKDIPINDGSVLTLTLSDQPLGHNLLTEPDGKMESLSRRGTPKEVLNEFQLMSLQEAWTSAKTLPKPTNVGGHNVAEVLYHDPADVDNWGNLGAWSIDLYWTTRSNKCRYEYWSTAPGDNECGALIRIDVGSVTCIGSGSDDGLHVFKHFRGDRVAMELVREGWPRFEREEEEAVLPWDNVDEAEQNAKAETEALKAIKAMSKLTPNAKKKAMKKLPLNVQTKVAMAMKASSPATTGNSAFDTMTGGGLFGAVPTASASSLFGAPPATTGKGVFDSTTGGGLFGAVPAASGSSLFGAPLATTGNSAFDTTTGGGLFGAVPATTVSSLFGAPLATTDKGAFDTTTGGGLFGAVPTASGSSLFGTPLATTGTSAFDTTTGGGLFGAVPATTASSLFGAPLATTDKGFLDTTTGGGLFGAVPTTTGGNLFGAPPATTGEALTTTGSGLFGAPQVATDPGSCHSSSVGTSSKQEECKVQ